MLVAQRRQSFRIGFAATHGAENATSANAEKIADHRRQLDTAFFQQALDLVLQLNPFANQLQAASRNHPPGPLPGFGHEAQHQFAGGEAAQQAFAVRQVRLASLRRLVGLRLRQMQLHMRLQFHPDRLPVLRRALHDGLAHFILHQPRR